MKYQFLLEEPSSTDQFKGESHKMVAKAIADTIENCPDVHIIGLEGTLGSGKSTVINILNGCLDASKNKFITFDVEQYHHSSTKRAFIECMTDHIDQVITDNNSSKRVSKAKDKALGNLLKYTKCNKSTLSWWVIAFIISVLFSTQAFIPFVDVLENYKSYNSGSSNAETPSILEGMILFVTAFSPFLIIGLLIIRNVFLHKYRLPLIGRFFNPKKENNNDEDIDLIPTVGDLFRRNSFDKITEKIEVTREVGSIELRNSMQVFINEIPDQLKFILTIDNLDRVPKDKVKEVWSDLEIFTSIAKNSLKIILPYSSSHIAKAISEDHHEGYEFIAKRIPVSFRVPPIVSAGWQDTFESFWKEATTEISTVDIRACADFLDTWLPKSYNNQVTPRLLKRFINDVISLLITTPVKVSPVSVAFYLVTIMYSEKSINIENIIKIVDRSDNDFDSSKKPTVTSDQQQITESQKRLAMHTKEYDINWPVQLMCIHFQTTQDIAQSELLSEPLSRAIKQHDADQLISRKDIYGFDGACQKLLSNASNIDVIKLCKAMLDVDEKYAKKWIKRYLPTINHELNDQLKISPNYEHDSEFVESLSSVANHGIDIDLSPVDRLYRENIKEINKYNNQVPVDKKQTIKYKGLISLYEFSYLLKIKPTMVTKPTGDFYVNNLWPFKEKWNYWEIESIVLDKKQIMDALSTIFDDESDNTTDSLLVLNILQRIKLGLFDFSGELPNKHTIELPAIDNLQQNAELSNLHELVFDHRWYTTDLIPYYIGYINNISDKEQKALLIAQAMVHMIQQGTLTQFPTLSSLIDEQPDSVDHIYMYLPLVTNFLLIINALSNKDIFKYLKDPVKQLIVNDKILRLDLKSILTKHYSILQSVIPESKALLKWTEGWFTVETFEGIDLILFGSSFIQDTLENPTIVQKYKSYLYEKLDNKTITSKYWLDVIYGDVPNSHDIVVNMASTNYSLTYADTLINAIDKAFSDAQIEKLESLNNPKLFNMLLSLLKDTSSDQLLSDFSNKLFINSVPNECKRSIIVNLHDGLKLPVITDGVDQKVFIALISGIGDNIDVANWLDHQKYYFDSWEDEVIKALVTFISAQNDDMYPTLRTDAKLARFFKYLAKKNENEQPETEG